MLSDLLSLTVLGALAYGLIWCNGGSSLDASFRR